MRIRSVHGGDDALPLGRLILYGLAAGGSEGVRSVLEFLFDDSRKAMLLAGSQVFQEAKRVTTSLNSVRHDAGSRFRSLRLRQDTATVVCSHGASRRRR